MRRWMMMKRKEVAGMGLMIRISDTNLVIEHEVNNQANFRGDNDVGSLC